MIHAQQALRIVDRHGFKDRINITKAGQVASLAGRPSREADSRSFSSHGCTNSKKSQIQEKLVLLWSNLHLVSMRANQGKATVKKNKGEEEKTLSLIHQPS